LDSGSRIVTEKLFRNDDEYLKDHFPGSPLVPATLILESMVQAAVWLARAGTGFEHLHWMLDGVSMFKVSRPIRPEAMITSTVNLEIGDSGKDDRMALRAQASASGETIASARFTLRRAEPPVGLDLSVYGKECAARIATLTD